MLRSLYVMLDYHIAATDGVQGTKIANKSAAVASDHRSRLGNREEMIVTFCLPSVELSCRLRGSS